LNAGPLVALLSAAWASSETCRITFSMAFSAKRTPTRGTVIAFSACTRAALPNNSVLNNNCGSKSCENAVAITNYWAKPSALLIVGGDSGSCVQVKATVLGAQFAFGNGAVVRVEHDADHLALVGRASRRRASGGSREQPGHQRIIGVPGRSFCARRCLHRRELSVSGSQKLRCARIRRAKWSSVPAAESDVSDG
jgi:hypothetical protein